MACPLQREAREANHAEVVEEDKRSKLPKNYEARKRRAEYEEDYERRKKVGVTCGMRFIFIIHP